MRLPKQVIALIALAVIATLVPLAGAQRGSVLVDGSAALFPFAQTTALAYRDLSDAEVIVNISGEEVAFAAMCGDELDIVNATRPITEDEAALCQEHGVQWVELLIAMDGLAVFSTDSETTCLSLDDLKTLYGDEGPAIYGRGREYQQFFMSVVGLDAMRADFLAATDDLNTLAGLTQSEEAVAYVSLGGGLASGLTPVAIDGGDGCVAPSVETVNTGDYPLGRKLYMYVNIGSGERVDVAGFVEFLLTAQNLSRLPALNLIPFQESVYALNANNWARRTTGQTFSAAPVEIGAVAGEDLTLIDGVAELSAAIRRVTDETTAEHPGLAYELAINGSDRAIARLCNAEVDLASARRPITDAESAACAANNVQFIELLVGLNPIVVVANPANDWATCLNLNQLNLVFGAENERRIVQWAQLQDGFPPFDLSIYTPLAPASAAYAEMMGATRTDVTAGDVAAGVAGDANAIGFTSYGGAVAAGSAVKTLAVNAGAGCIAPTEADIQGGAYPLTQPLYIYVNAESALRPAVQLVALGLLTSDAVAESGFVSPATLDLTLSMDALRTGATGTLLSR